MAEGIYKVKVSAMPKKRYAQPQIGFGSLSYASDKKKKLLDAEKGILFSD